MTRLKKRIMTVLVAGMLVLSGCGNKDNGSTGASTEAVTEQKTTESASTEAKTEAKTESKTEAKTEASTDKPESSKHAGKTADEILAELTLEQKAAQMVMPAIYNTSVEEMKQYGYGGVLSKTESLDPADWRKVIDELQAAALASPAGIPFLYGQDDVHGVNYALNTVIFPHNIGAGAANDPELMYQVGLITADEANMSHMPWNYSPVVAQSVDPRWGRTYESYGADLDIIKSLSLSYSKGLLDGGMVVCAKHFFGDGNVGYGTGEKDNIEMLMDRGDATLSEDEIKELLSVYQQLIDNGVQTVMISHSSLNGVKMHENEKYIQYLKNEMGFKGFVASDWDSVQHITGSSYEEQVTKSINAGIDMFMEVATYNDVIAIIVAGVEGGTIKQERIDDAVRRILQVKIDAGLMDDPYMKNYKAKESQPGSAEYRAVAEKLVEESLVLLKNDGNVLPLKEGTKVYITGPAADNDVAQCGGWTIDWNESNLEKIPGLTTIKAGFEQVAAEHGITVTTNKDEADVVLLVVGEQSYAEWNGDTEDLALTGALGLSGNQSAIQEAKELRNAGKKVVTCVVAGRQVILGNAYTDSDSVVMCYLPGSEGQGVAKVLCGEADFKGKLPSPWYDSVDQIGKTPWLEKGFGLTYGN